MKFNVLPHTDREFKSDLTKTTQPGSTSFYKLSNDVNISWFS